MSDLSLLATLELTKLALVSTPSPTPSSMPITNVLHYQPAKVASLLDLTQTSVTFNLTLSLAAADHHGLSSYRYILVIGSNITSSGTVEAFTGPDESSVSSAVTSTLHILPQLYWLTPESNLNRFPVRHTLIDLGSQRTEPYLRLVFSDLANPAGYLDLGTILIHPGYVPTLPITSKPQLSVSATPDIVTTVSGSKHTRVRPLFRKRTFSMQAIGPTAQAEVLEQWVALQETVGLHDPIALVTNISASSHYMDGFVYGTLTSLSPVLLPELWGKSEINIEIEELK